MERKGPASRGSVVAVTASSNNSCSFLFRVLLRWNVILGQLDVQHSKRIGNFLMHH